MRPKHILPVIIFSQFAGTSLWFAGNAIIDDLMIQTGMGLALTGYIISSVQFGFIIGTLLFAIFMIADRYSPSLVFLICALLASLCNLVLLTTPISVTVLLLARFGTGFFLAGIYPVGMKIAADYYEQGLGKALGWLVGALVMGTALPYLVNSFGGATHYTDIIILTSALSAMGGFALFILVPSGPFRKPSTQLQIRASASLFKIQGFRTAATGYFGHMWELYAFWALTPLAFASYGSQISVSLLTGITIGLGAFSCVFGGYIAQRFGSKKVATTALLISGCFCLLSPFLFELPPIWFAIGWGLWGMAVTADSPQFSNLVAAAVPAQLKATALTLVNCIGFAISIISIQLLSVISELIETQFIFLILVIGPILGVQKLLKSVG